MRHQTLSLYLSVIACIFVLVPTAHAIFYAPGATLDPACGPTDSNCGVTSTAATGTVGQVPYYAAAGNILAATSTMTILANGNVGIGTASPNFKLDINGSLNAVDGTFSGVLTIPAGSLNLGNVPTVFTSNTTYTVKTSGGDFTTVAAAVASLGKSIVDSSHAVTVVVDDGVWVQPTNLRGFYQSGYGIRGAHTYTKTMSSVQSSSGSAGAYSIVINLDSVTNITTSDYVVISNPSGGSNPSYIAGVFPVTNVDAVNNRITITSMHLGSAAPSGAVTATVKVIKTILTFSGTDGIQLWEHGYLALQDVVLVGNNTVGTAGISIQDSSRLYTTGTVGVTGFDLGGFLLYNSEWNSGGVVALSGNNTGLDIDQESSFESALVSSGNTVTGIQSYNNSSTHLLSASSVTGNQYGIRSDTGSWVNAESSAITGNTFTGMYTNKGGRINYLSATFANNLTDNTSNGLDVDGNNNFSIGTSTKLGKLNVNGNIYGNQLSVTTAAGDANAVINRSGNDLNLQTTAGYNILLHPANSVSIINSASTTLAVNVTTGFSAFGMTAAPDHILSAQSTNDTVGNYYPINAVLQRVNTSASPRGVGISFTERTAGSVATHLAVMTAIRNNSNANWYTSLTFGVNTTNSSISESGLTELMRLDGSTRNIGMGTTSPFALLSISNSAATPANGTLFAVASTTGGTSTSTVFSIASTGNVTINGSSGSSCIIGNGVGATSCTSDERLKTNIALIVNPLQSIEQLRGVTFNWADPTKNQSQFIGVIAQDVQKVFPQVVSTTADGYLAVDYAALVAPLIEAVKELAGQVTALAATVTGFGQKFTTQELCVGDTCVTESQLKAMLQNSGQQASQTPAPVVTSTTTSDITTTSASMTIDTATSSVATTTVATATSTTDTTTISDTGTTASASTATTTNP